MTPTSWKGFASAGILLIAGEAAGLRPRPTLRGREEAGAAAREFEGLRGMLRHAERGSETGSSPTDVSGADGRVRTPTPGAERGSGVIPTDGARLARTRATSLHPPTLDTDMRVPMSDGLVFTKRFAAPVLPHEARFNTAIDLMFDRKDAEALPTIQEVLNEKPDWPEALLARASIANRQDRPAEAKADAEAVLRARPDDPGALLLRGVANQKLGELRAALDDLDSARRRWTKGCNLVPRAVYATRGQIRLSAGYLVGALSDFELQVRNEGREARGGLWNRGATRFLLGQDALADQDFEQWLAFPYRNDAEREVDAADLKRFRKELAELRSGTPPKGIPFARPLIVATPASAVAHLETAFREGDCELLTKVLDLDDAMALSGAFEASKDVSDAKRRAVDFLRTRFPNGTIPELPGDALEQFRASFMKPLKLEVLSEGEGAKERGLEVKAVLGEDVTNSQSLRMTAVRRGASWSLAAPSQSLQARSLIPLARRMDRYARDLPLVLSLKDPASLDEAVRRAQLLWAKAVAESR